MPQWQKPIVNWWRHKRFTSSLQWIHNFEASTLKRRFDSNLCVGQSSNYQVRAFSYLHDQWKIHFDQSCGKLLYLLMLWGFFDPLLSILSSSESKQTNKHRNNEIRKAKKWSEEKKLCVLWVLKSDKSLLWCCGEYVSNLVWILKVWNMLVVRQLVRNLVKSMVNFFSESDYSSKFLSVLGTPKYSVTFTLYYEFMSFHVKINRHHYALCTQCGNYGNSLSRIFGKNFVKITILLTKLLNS